MSTSANDQRPTRGAGRTVRDVDGSFPRRRPTIAPPRPASSPIRAGSGGALTHGALGLAAAAEHVVPVLPLMHPAEADEGVVGDGDAAPDVIHP